MKTWMFLAALVLAAAIAAAQTPSPAPPAATPQAQAAQAPAGDADTGKKLYVSHGCYACHGYEGQGAPPVRELRRDRSRSPGSSGSYGGRRT